MLYEHWLEVARAHPDRLALWDGASGQSYTFRQLAQMAEEQGPAQGAMQFASGAGMTFVLAVLAGWRDQKVLVPLELGQPQPAIDPAPPAPIAHLKTTSATTGASRMIAFTAEQLEADCENVVTTMGLDPAIPNVGAISLAHSYGFSNLVLPLLLKGIPLLLAASALPESVRTAVEHGAAVAVASVPALWQTWHDAGIVSDRIRIAISAGAPLPLALEREVFESTRVKIHNFYGSSECGGIAYDRTEVPRRDAALAGTPMDGVEVSLSGEGCVTVKSRAVGTGFWPIRDPILANGVFQSGDLGEITHDGVYLRGRVSDRINVAGRKVIPEEVERALAGHPKVKDCLVFGVPADGVRNEAIVACVVPREGVSSAKLAEFLQARLPSWQVPREWWMVESLDVNVRGKRARAEWRERYVRERGIE